MLLETHLRLTMSVLCCFSLDVLWLTGAAPTIERSITIEQCPGRRLQIPQIFLHTSDSHLCLNCFSDQPNDVVMPMIQIYLPRVEARLRGITTCSKHPY